MRKSFVILSLLFCLFQGFSSLAGGKPKVELQSVKLAGQTVEVTLKADKPFIFGNNRYILHVGEEKFYLNRQTIINGTGTMTFMVPVQDFDALPEGTAFYITYGELSASEISMNLMDKDEHMPLWSLGSFSKTLLTK